MAKKNLHSISVFAPATVANLACGFDVMGLAIDSPGDEVRVEFNRTKEIRIRKISGDGGKLSLDALKNTAAVSIKALIDDLHIDQGFDIYIKKKMPLGSGLGSSAASSVAGVFAANELLGKPYSRRELVPFAMEGERIACGSAHADNVAPSMMGGIVLIRSYQPLDIISLPVPKKLMLVVVHPEVEVLTKDSRAVLPRKIDMSTGISQWANTAAFTAGLYTNDFDLIARSVVDHVAEPHRAALIPYFEEVKSAALFAGAVACSISGSGPSVFAMAEGKKEADEIAYAMKYQFKKHKIKCTAYISAVNTKGVVKLKS
jgi:homoserine kinase